MYINLYLYIYILRLCLSFDLVTDWMLDRDPQEEVFKAFRLFDDDDSGKISLRNLRRVARELGENMTDEELRAMIDEFDKDGDGESEFLISLLATCFDVACKWTSTKNSRGFYNRIVRYYMYIEMRKKT